MINCTFTNNSDSFTIATSISFLIFSFWYRKGKTLNVGVFYVLLPWPVVPKVNRRPGKLSGICGTCDTGALCLGNESGISCSNFQLPVCVGGLSFLKLHVLRFKKKKSTLQLPALLCRSVGTSHRDTELFLEVDLSFLSFARKEAAPRVGFLYPLPRAGAGGWTLPALRKLAPWSGMCGLISIQPSLLRGGGGGLG